ncbi:MAG: aminotransferase class I/II-fold pyridoxal phosphate-dependent enzyme [Vicinamibacterales bacterium]|jgi:histidinol-phosphate aminotransferase|nr:aminotransferase class I/II-fold pyridoxal phosphate-dependent enzyme [Vicinamibacterales bacterium]MDP7672557.1 aminotransferase class I/II-fold pyridoxal phosphate-dependent enzyme [Vicinamibacterales bacterium]HJO39724.1 aminotransferase class I/II-fold pyridoxal phosphate-dependent enzyme [Vicinamibacterales bacterium]|tara:strand:- start:5317 stop:6480 length:1164 start_codon:yes stop_codon:yes gene_type:complete
MSLSRRAFVRSLGIGGAGALSTGWVFGRNQEALAWSPDPLAAAAQAATQEIIRISGNENARGPGRAAVEAMEEVLHGNVGRYGFSAPADLAEALSRSVGHGLTSENVITSTGSGALLQAGTRAYVSPSRPLVNATPSFLSTNRTAETLGADIRLVPVLADLSIDLDGMAEAANGAGMVFLCNPNNPTATAHSHGDIAAFIRKVKSSSPSTAILVDEAYIEYATDPAVDTAAAEALEYDDVFITRTFSKAYGMAGMRLGWAAGRPATLAKLQAAWGLGNINVMTAAGALASLDDPDHMVAEREENRRIREFTINAFKEMGYEATDSQTNFLFVNIRQPASDFRDAAAEQGVMVGRDFPPMENSHSRISLGTMEEMQRAVEVFKRILET